MRRHSAAWLAIVLYTTVTAGDGVCEDPSAAPLPAGVKAVWDVGQAHRETTATRERISINGLWRWQPAEGRMDQPPVGNWGYFKVPGCWPGISDYMQKDCQTVYAHPNWKDVKLAAVAATWHQREIGVPEQWAGRRVVLRLEYLNSKRRRLRGRPARRAKSSFRRARRT